MKNIQAVFNLIAGFFMVALHAQSLDAPTRVVEEFQKHFSAPQKESLTEAQVRHYIEANLLRYPASEGEPLNVARLSKLVLKLAHQYRFHPGLLLSIMRVESRFQPQAESSQGALGLMQIMPETGAWLAKRYDLQWNGKDTLLNPETNLIYGVRYLDYLREKFGADLKKILSAYNRGPAKVDEELTLGQSIALGYYYKVKEHFNRM